MTEEETNAPVASPDSALLADYTPLGGAYDELYAGAGKPRPELARVAELLGTLSDKKLKRMQRLADAAFVQGGVTFSVYSDRRGVEKTFPFDLIPRVIGARDWDVLERGLKQRLRALNLFLSDLYGDQKILKEDRIPRALIESSEGFYPEMQGFRPPGGLHVLVAGVDLLRKPDGAFVVLEDNLRVPSGVSYVLENRTVMKRVIPSIFREARVRTVDDYPLRLRDTLASVADVPAAEACVVVMTPGAYNSAYFEHSFLAQRMGCPLVEGRDLFVHDDKVFMKTTRGPQRVHVIYRRLDDAFLDPHAFREDSVLGVPGLVGAHRAGNVALANAIGNGVADDKAIYPHVPEMIRFYLSEDPILEQVETYECSREQDRRHVLDNLERMVVKAVDGAGGYGMLVGPKASRAEIAAFRDRVREKPRGYIAQPVIDFSTCPTLTKDGVGPRRVDLRPYVLTGANGVRVLAGGLTRVALTRGSYVVNSSQGGGSKDTWVLRREPKQ